MIEQHAEMAQKVATTATYTIGTSLMIGDTLQWLNHNAGAVGAIATILTFFVNWYYQRKRNRCR